MDHYLDALSLWLLSWTTILLCCKNISDKSKPQAHEISLSVCWDVVASMIFTWYGAKNTERMVLRKLGASFHPRLRFTSHLDRPLVGKLSYFYLVSLVPPSNQPLGIVCQRVCMCTGIVNEEQCKKERWPTVLCTRFDLNRCSPPWLPLPPRTHTPQPLHGSTFIRRHHPSPLLLSPPPACPLRWKSHIIIFSGRHTARVRLYL